MSPRTTTPPEIRFWQKVDKAGDCWAWTASTNTAGYGTFWVSRERKFVDAHRFSFEIANGPIELGAVVMHSCDNRPCVKPAHLSAGTTLDNIRDMCAKGRSSRQRQTHCKSGHEFTDENTFRQSNGSRGCRTCARRWGREYKERLRAA